MEYQWKFNLHFVPSELAGHNLADGIEPRGSALLVDDVKYEDLAILVLNIEAECTLSCVSSPKSSWIAATRWQPRRVGVTTWDRRWSSRDGQESLMTLHDCCASLDRKEYKWSQMDGEQRLRNNGQATWTTPHWIGSCSFGWVPPEPSARLIVPRFQDQGQLDPGFDNVCCWHWWLGMGERGAFCPAM